MSEATETFDFLLRYLQLLALPLILAIIRQQSKTTKKVKRDVNQAHAKLRAVERETGKVVKPEPSDFRKGSL